MEKQLEELKKAFCEDLEQTRKPEDIDPLRITYLGRKGRLTSILRMMGSLDPAERPRMGALSNELKVFIEEKLDEKAKSFAADVTVRGIDVTMPGRVLRKGSIHVLNQVMNEVEASSSTSGSASPRGPKSRTTTITSRP